MAESENSTRRPAGQRVDAQDYTFGSIDRRRRGGSPIGLRSRRRPRGSRRSRLDAAATPRRIGAKVLRDSLDREQLDEDGVGPMGACSDQIRASDDVAMEMRREPRRLLGRHQAQSRDRDRQR